MQQQTIACAVITACSLRLPFIAAQRSTYKVSSKQINASAKSYGTPARNIEVIRQCWSCLTQCRSCKTQFTVPCYTLHTSQARWLHRFLTCSCTMFLDSATVIDPAMNSAVPPPLTYRCCSCCASHSGSRVTNVRTAAGATARASSPALHAPFLCRTVLPIAAPAVPLAGSSATDVSTAAEQLDQPHPQPYTSWSSSSFTSHYCSCCVSHSGSSATDVSTAAGATARAPSPALYSPSLCKTAHSITAPAVPATPAAAQPTSALPQVQLHQPQPQPCTPLSSPKHNFNYCPCCASHSGSSATDVSTAAGATARAPSSALYSPFLSNAHFPLLLLLCQPFWQQRNRRQHRRRCNSPSLIPSPVLPGPH